MNTAKYYVFHDSNMCRVVSGVTCFAITFSDYVIDQLVRPSLFSDFVRPTNIVRVISHYHHRKQSFLSVSFLTVHSILYFKADYFYQTFIVHHPLTALRAKGFCCYLIDVEFVTFVRKRSLVNRTSLMLLFYRF